MTRTKMYVLTGVSALFYMFLTWAFADDQFSPGDFYLADDIFASSFWTFLFLAIIIGAGVYQARKLPEAGVTITTQPDTETPGQMDDPRFWKLFLGNAYFAILWLPLRFFVGKSWASAGEHKLRDDGWMSGGASLKAYWERAIAIPEPPARPAINENYDWYRTFLKYMLDNEWYTWFAKLIAIGEFLIGIALIAGALVGIAAFFGTFMNINFMLAGTASTNPVLFGLGVFMVLGWKVAGYLGVDRYLLPLLGAPWRLGRLFGEHAGQPLVPGMRREPA